MLFEKLKELRELETLPDTLKITQKMLESDKGTLRETL